MHNPTAMPASEPFQPHGITRPHPQLLKYYLLVTLLTGPFSPFVILPLIFKYYTLRYEFDDRGVAMKWGVVFRREVLLTYRRIQDIHLTRNVLQRWLGLANVSLQTASGSAGAEMVIEGILEADELRDYLYSKMRGARHETATENGAPGAHGSVVPGDEALALLREIRDSLAQLSGRREAAP